MRKLKDYSPFPPYCEVFPPEPVKPRRSVDKACEVLGQMKGKHAKPPRTYKHNPHLDPL